MEKVGLRRIIPRKTLVSTPADRAAQAADTPGNATAHMKSRTFQNTALALNEGHHPVG